MRYFLLTILVLICVSSVTFGQHAEIILSDQQQSTPIAAQKPNTLERVIQAISNPQRDSEKDPLTELEKLTRQLQAQQSAQKTIQHWVTVIAGTIIVAALIAFVLQTYTLVSDAGNRKRNREERALQNQRDEVERSAHSQREEALHQKLLEVLNIATQSAESAQQKLEHLEESGIRRAGETLELINSLLQITERSAARAAGAEVEFLSRNIESLEQVQDSLNRYEGDSQSVEHMI